MLIPSTPINSYQLLDLLGLIEPVGEYVKLSDRAVVLKDDIPIQGLPNSKTFTLDKILNEKIFKKEELWTALQNLPYLKHLRVFFAKFRPDQDGRITQKADLWDQIKAWRYDIDVVKDEDLLNDRERAIQKINEKVRDIQELIQKLPLPPNLVKRSNKGWHLIYVLKEFITRDAYETYLKHYNNPKPNKDDDIADQFIVFELLSKYIPKYLVELDPNIGLDIQASKKISSIATRFVSDDLPAYVLNPPYLRKDLRKAFEFLLLDNTEEEVVYKQGKTPYTVKDISKNTFLSLMDRCSVLKALDEDWENHSEYEWYVMTNYYAIRILYAETPKEAEELRQEFHDKSSRWYGNGNKQYSYNEAERQLQYYIRKQEEGLKPPACKYIYHNLSSKYTMICHTCPYRRFDINGNMIANFIFDGLRNDSLEEITIPGWELRDDGWYMEVSDEKGKTPPIWIKILPYFKIRAHYLVGEDDIELLDIVDKRGISAIKRIERRKDTYLVTPELVKSYGFVNPNWISASKKFLTYYVEKVKEQRGVKINFLGYRFINGFWDIAVGGYGNYRRKDLGYIFYGQEINDQWFIPSIQGHLDIFKDIYYYAFRLDDPALHLAIAHYLSWIGLQFIDDRSFKAHINPILIFVGDTGTGKTVRAKIAAGLYGNPAVFSFTNITQASFNNRFPLIKAPFTIDEVMTKNQRDEEKLGELLYNIGNKNGKMTSFATHNPLEVPVILTGETENLLVDKLFSTYRGLTRRSIVIKMTTEYKDNSDILDDILDGLYQHYGHILSYVKSLTKDDIKMIEGYAYTIYNLLTFGDSSFKELRRHLTLSLAMFKHFYKHFIGLSVSEIDNKIKKVIEFVSKNTTEHQLSKVGDTIDYVEEVIEFISSVKKAEKMGISLRGMTYKGLISKIDYKPSDKVGELLKKFFWKKYAYKKSTDYRFIDTSLLLCFPNQPTDLSEEIEKIYNEFTKEELAIWLRVAEAKFGKDGLDGIKRSLVYHGEIGKKLLDKFPELRPLYYVKVTEQEE